MPTRDRHEHDRYPGSAPDLGANLRASPLAITGVVPSAHEQEHEDGADAVLARVERCTR